MSREASIQKNVSGALMLLAMAEAAGDREKADVARAGLRECGYPGGEGLPSLAEVVARAEAVAKSRVQPSDR